MDTERFDTLARSLTRGGSRRHALTGLVAGALGLLGTRAQQTAAHDLKATCKKKSGDAKKKCLKKAKKHAAEHAAEGTSGGGGGNDQSPPHVCAGKNVCATPDAPTFCQTGGADCVCAVRADGAPLCAATAPAVRAVAACGDCLQGEICMDITGCPFAPTRLGCVQPCPNRPTCTDTVKNGDESDVDCGGSCPRCVDNKTCNARNDCISALCVSNVCTACTSNGSCGGTNCSCLNGRCVQNAPTSVTNCGSCPRDTYCVPNTLIQNRYLCYPRCSG